jgi:hypothetical protein
MRRLFNSQVKLAVGNGFGYRIGGKNGRFQNHLAAESTFYI